MAYRVATEFKFPAEWTESERCEFTDAGVCRADWFDGPTYEDRTYKYRTAAEAVVRAVEARYKGPDVNGVEVAVSVEEC